MTAYYTKAKNPLEPLSPDEFANFSFEDYRTIEDQKKDKQQFMTPTVTSGRMAAIQVENLPATSRRDSGLLNDSATVPPPVPQSDSAGDPALCRVSFVGPDQQWYSVKIGHAATGSMQAMPAQPGQQMPMMQAPMMQGQMPMMQGQVPMMQGQVPMMQMPMMQGQMPMMQPSQQMPMMQAPMMQGQMPMMQMPMMQPSQQIPMMQAPMMQATGGMVQMPMMQAPAAAMQAPVMQPQQQTAQAQQALHKSWRDDDPSMMYGNPNMRTTEWEPDAAKSKDDGDSNKDFILQIVQPGLTGLMDGSVSTLAPIFSVAFATHNPFTAFIVGLASALGAGISMTFSEALSDDGEISGRGRPFLRGGVTGLMTFLSGLGHALPFLIPDLHLALTMAYVVVAVELVVIAAIRHKFFGTGWLLSMIQVVGGGALVFAVALLLGNV